MEYLAKVYAKNDSEGSQESIFYVDSIIHETKNAVLYRAFQEKDKQSYCVLKFYKVLDKEGLVANKTPGIDIRQEYEMANKIEASISTNKNVSGMNVIKKIERVCVVSRVVVDADHDEVLFSSAIVKGNLFGLMNYTQNGEFLKDLFVYEDSIPIYKRIEYGINILEAVHTLHKCGYLHLDIHPGNIFIEGANWDQGKTTGRIFFIDFANSAPICNERQSFLYTEGFSAEELYPATGSLYNIGEQTDLFSVGKVIYWMLFGRVVLDYDCDITKEQINCQNNYITIEDDLLCTLFDGLLYYRNSTYNEILELLREISKDITLVEEGDLYAVLVRRYERGIRSNSIDWSFAMNAVISENYNKSCFRKDIWGYLADANDRVRDEINELYYDPDKYYYVYGAIKAINQYAAMQLIDMSFEYKLLTNGYSITSQNGYLSENKKIEEICRVMGRLLKANELDKMIADVRKINRLIDQLDYSTAYTEADAMIRSVMKRLNDLDAIKIEYPEFNKKAGWVLSACATAKTYCIAYQTGFRDEEVKEIYRCFGEAIRRYREDQKNIDITRTHYLQSAITFKDFDKYTELSKHIRNGLSLLELYNASVDKFDFLAIIKGLYVFGKEGKVCVTKEEVDDLIQVKRIINKYVHPYQLIYKYIGLLVHANYKGRDKNSIVKECFGISEQICDNAIMREPVKDGKHFFGIFDAMKFQNEIILKYSLYKEECKNILECFEQLIQPDRCRLKIDASEFVNMKKKDKILYIKDLIVHENS